MSKATEPKTQECINCGEEKDVDVDSVSPFVLQEWYYEGMSCQQIAERLGGITRGGVDARLRKVGTKFRDRGLAQRIAKGRRAAIDSTGYVRWGESRVHRIVCEAWHGPRPSPDHTVNHIDGDKLNNHPENLEWVTNAENVRHAWRTGLMPEDFNHARGVDQGLSKLNPKKVREMRRLREEEGVTYAEIARRFEVSKSTAMSAIKRKTWSHVD